MDNEQNDQDARTRRAVSRAHEHLREERQYTAIAITTIAMLEETSAQRRALEKIAHSLGMIADVLTAKSK